MLSTFDKEKGMLFLLSLLTSLLSLPSLVAGYSPPPAQYDLCKGTSVFNPRLRFGLSLLPDPFGAGYNGSLAASICCDTRNQDYAEPSGLYADVKLFSHMDQSGITTFFDAACGLPLFKTPVNRSFAQFKSDTNEHGWPSFRDGEVFHDNVKTDTGELGHVTSKCGTHLGTYLPDAKGARWCIDLSCIAGTADWAGCCSGCAHGASGCGSGEIASGKTGQCRTKEEDAVLKACDCTC